MRMKKTLAVFSVLLFVFSLSMANVANAGDPLDSNDSTPTVVVGTEGDPLDSNDSTPTVVVGTEGDPLDSNDSYDRYLVDDGYSGDLGHLIQIYKDLALLGVWRF